MKYLFCVIPKHLWHIAHWIDLLLLIQRKAHQLLWCLWHLRKLLRNLSRRCPIQHHCLNNLLLSWLRTHPHLRLLCSCWSSWSAHIRWWYLLWFVLVGAIAIQQSSLSLLRARSPNDSSWIITILLHPVLIRNKQ